MSRIPRGARLTRAHSSIPWRVVIRRMFAGRLVRTHIHYRNLSSLCFGGASAEDAFRLRSPRLGSGQFDSAHRRQAGQPQDGVLRNDAYRFLSDPRHRSGEVEPNARPRTRTSSQLTSPPRRAGLSSHVGAGARIRRGKRSVRGELHLSSFSGPASARRFWTRPCSESAPAALRRSPAKHDVASPVPARVEVGKRQRTWTNQ